MPDGVNIDRSFIRTFQAEVYEQYQQIGSKLRNTVRTKDGIAGCETTFQPVGKGKDGLSPVACLLIDTYAGDWSDGLDKLKSSIGEQRVFAAAGAYALGRKADRQIIDELLATQNIVCADNSGLTSDKVPRAFESLDELGVPDDGQRFAVVGWKQWSDLLRIQEFAETDYVGDSELPWRGTVAKRWLGTLWFPHSGLPKSDNVRKCFWYHKTAIGHAIGAEVKTDITWHGDRAAHFVNNMMSQGACLIDGSGIVTIECVEA